MSVVHPSQITPATLVAMEQTNSPASPLDHSPPLREAIHSKYNRKLQTEKKGTQKLTEF
jgi:hypothetical protein